MCRATERLMILEPAVLPGLCWSRAVRRVNEALLRRRIKTVMRRLGFRDVATIVGTPFAADIAGSLCERLVVYDCNDDWAAIPRLPSPVIGSIGSINTTKDDLALLEAVAVRRPDWSFVFVGPVMEDVDLARYPALGSRARFLGGRWTCACSPIGATRSRRRRTRRRCSST